MAMKRFPCEKYASLELNQVAFPKTGMVVSQTPLGAKFVEGANNYGVCENGMWVVADKSAGYLDAPPLLLIHLLVLYIPLKKNMIFSIMA